MLNILGKSMSTQRIHNYSEVNIKQRVQFVFTTQSSDAWAKVKTKLVRLGKIFKVIYRKEEEGWCSELYWEQFLKSACTGSSHYFTKIIVESEQTESTHLFTKTPIEDVDKSFGKFWNTLIFSLWSNIRETSLILLE